MGPDTSRWRSSDIYDYLDQLGAPDLAWECLRRNAVYQRDFAESTRSSDATERLVELVGRQRPPDSNQPQHAAILPALRSEEFERARAASFHRGFCRAR